MEKRRARQEKKLAITTFTFLPRVTKSTHTAIPNRRKEFNQIIMSV
jgi:hypothetical protein